MPFFGQVNFEENKFTPPRKFSWKQKFKNESEEAEKMRANICAAKNSGAKRCQGEREETERGRMVEETGCGH